LSILHRVVDFYIVGVAKYIEDALITLNQQRPQIFLIDYSCLLNPKNRFWLSVAENTQIIVLNYYRLKAIGLMGE
jgi:hypothetical protein